jgi:hypothetical protein
LFDSRFKIFKGKLTTRWLGPYEVVTMFDNGDIKIKTIDDEHVSFVVNGNILKLYHKPISIEDFMQVMSANKEFALVDGEVSSPSPCS